MLKVKFLRKARSFFSSCNDIYQLRYFFLCRCLSCRIDIDTLRASEMKKIYIYKYLHRVSEIGIKSLCFKINEKDILGKGFLFIHT